MGKSSGTGQLIRLIKSPCVPHEIIRVSGDGRVTQLRHTFPFFFRTQKKCFQNGLSSCIPLAPRVLWEQGICGSWFMRDEG